jgi:hypothetical protein
MQGNGVKTVFYEGRHRILTYDYVEEHACKWGRCRYGPRSIFPRSTPCFSLNCHSERIPCSLSEHSGDPVLTGLQGASIVTFRYSMELRTGDFRDRPVLLPTNP